MINIWKGCNNIFNPLWLKKNIHHLHVIKIQAQELLPLFSFIEFNHEFINKCIKDILNIVHPAVAFESDWCGFKKSSLFETRKNGWCSWWQLGKECWQKSNKNLGMVEIYCGWWKYITMFFFISTADCTCASIKLCCQASFYPNEICSLCLRKCVWISLESSYVWSM